MAESVDASVSNTDGAIRPGSTPGSGTKKEELTRAPLFLSISCHMIKNTHISVASSHDNEIILNQPDSTVKLEVRLENG